MSALVAPPLPATNTTDTCEDCAQIDEGFLTAFIINVCFFALWLLIFLVFKKLVPAVYEPLSERNKAGKLTVPPPNGGLFGWIRSSLTLDEDEIIKKRGLDAFLYLLFMKYCFWMFTSFMVFGFIVLVPIHYVASDKLTGLSALTMGNIEQESNYLWADVASVLLNTAVANVVLYLLYRRYTNMRIDYRHSDFAENYTVMVRELDEFATEESVKLVFENLFPGEVVSVRMAYETDTLWDKLDFRERVGKKWEKAQTYYALKGKHNPCNKDCKGGCGNCAHFYCCYGKKLDDPITFFKATYDEFEATIRYKSKHKEFESARVAFVVMKSHTAAQFCALARGNFQSGSFSHPIERSWIVDFPPAWDSINWEFLWVSHNERWIRALIINCVTLVLIFLWIIPVSFVSGLTNLGALAETPAFSWLKDFESLPVISEIVEDFFPGLILTIFNYILYDYIITPLAEVERSYSHDVTARSIFNKYFLFQVFNTFLGTTLASGILAVIPQVIDNPAVVVELLATSLPSQWSFFSIYILINVLSSYDLASPKELFFYWLYRTKCCGKTKRLRRKAEELQTIDYAESYANHMITFLIAMSYSTLAPFLLIWAAVYFGIFYFYHRYQIIYVFYPSQPAAGNLFPAIFARCCWSIVVYHVLLGGVFALNIFIPGAAIMFVLACLELCFLFWTDKQFHQLSKYGNVAKSAQDIVAEQMPPPEKEDSLLKKAFDLSQTPLEVAQSIRMRRKDKSQSKVDAEASASDVELGDVEPGDVEMVMEPETPLNPQEEEQRRRRIKKYPHPDTYLYPTLRYDIGSWTRFVAEDQSPERIYHIPWPDLPVGPDTIWIEEDEDHNQVEVRPNQDDLVILSREEEIERCHYCKDAKLRDPEVLCELHQIKFPPPQIVMEVPELQVDEKPDHPPQQEDTGFCTIF